MPLMGQKGTRHRRQFQDRQDGRHRDGQSIAIAVYAFRTVPRQRSLEHVSNWGFRFLIGCMWWQQSLWKLPPFYTDHPEQPFGDTGLAYWIGVMGKSAATPFQADFVNNIVLPHSSRRSSTASKC